MMCWSNTVTSSAGGLMGQTWASFHKPGSGLSSVPPSLLRCCSQHLSIVHRGQMSHLAPLQDSRAWNNKGQSQLPWCNQIKVLSAPQTLHSWETSYQAVSCYENTVLFGVFYCGTLEYQRSLNIFKGQTIWLCCSELCRIHLPSSAICLPRAMSSCLLAESEDWSLFYYYWTPFMLIINHFNNLVPARLRQTRYCTRPRSTLSIQEFWGHHCPSFSSLCYLHPLTTQSPGQELPGSAKTSSVLISWGAKRPGLQLRYSSRSHGFLSKTALQEILLMVPCWEDFSILFSYQRRINIK